MACRRLPYYHRFLHRENFSSPLEVVYRKPLREEKGCWDKYQWDLIHNPASMLFSWLEDEKEAEMISITDLLTQLREANQSEEQSIEIMQDQCPNALYKDVSLGDNKVDYLQINCSKEFQNAEIDEERINSVIKVELKFGSNLMLSPSEKSLVYSQTTLGDAIAYQFHEAKVGQAPVAVELTDNFLFEFVVLKKDREKFEQYLFPTSRSVKIEAALEDMEAYLGNDYEQESGSLRTDLSEEGTDNMDCSEFMSRYLQKACGSDEVPEYTTSVMIDFVDKPDDMLQFLVGSDKEDFKDVKPGDVFLWRRSSGGHTGVVVSYDEITDLVTVMEAIGESGSAEEGLSKNTNGYCKECVRKSIYSRLGGALFDHEGWIGYFRPIIK